MPLHDWSRVPGNVFHAFHLGLLWNLAGALNEGLLPAGYVARPEESLGPYEAGVLTLQDPGAGEAPADGASAEPRPTLTLAPPRLEARKERRVAVYSARGERRVAVLEVVSPGNKDSERRARLFETKLLDCVAAGLNVVLIDLLPATGPAPGFSAALACELGAGREALLDGGLEATSFERRDEQAILVYHRRLTVGAELPSVPLFLAPKRYVDVPLGPSYRRTIARLPAPDRALLDAR